MGANVKVELGLPIDNNNVGEQSYGVFQWTGQNLNNLSKRYKAGGSLFQPTMRNDGQNIDAFFSFGNQLPANWVLGKDGGYNGYLWGLVQSNGKINDYYLKFAVEAKNSDGTTTGCNTSRLTMYGDKTFEQWATEVIVDEYTDTQKTITNNKNEFIIDFDGEKSSRTVKITKWNKIGSHATITHIEAFGNSIVFDERWIKSVDSLAQSTATPSEVRFGVLANTGRMEINDFNGDIARYIKDGIISSGNAPVIVKAKNTTIQHHVSQDSEYLDSKFSVDLTNRLAEMDSRKYDGRELSAETTLYSLICEVLETYLNGDRSFIHGDKYFDDLRISGASGANEVTRTSKKPIPYVSNHKYYISYYFKADGFAGGTTELFFPITAGNSITSPAIQNEGEWQRASGIVQGVNTTGSQSFRIDYNNTGNFGCVDFRDIIILDLNANGLEDKSLAWCNENIVTSADVDNMFTGYAYREAYNDYLTLLQWVKYIKIPYPYLEPDTYRATIDKLCTVGLLRLYCDDNDNLKFVTALPTADPSELQINFGAYNIPKRYTFGGLKKSLFVKNKVDRVDIKENIVNYEKNVVLNLLFKGYLDDDYKTDGSYQPNFINKNSFDVTTMTFTDAKTQVYAIFTQTIDIDGRTKYDDFSGSYKHTIRGVEPSVPTIFSTIIKNSEDINRIGLYNSVSDFTSTLGIRITIGDSALVEAGLISSQSTDKRLKFIFAVRIFNDYSGGYEYTLDSDIELIMKTLIVE